jgi:hypothetical protein
MAIQRTAKKSAAVCLPKPRDTELTRCALGIATVAAAERLWQRVLTEEERQRLGGDFRTAYAKHRTAGMWMKLRGVSRDRAIVDVAHAVDLITDATHEWLLRELGQLPSDSEQAIEDAVQAGDLVLVERPRAAYWKGKPIEADWEKRNRLWDVLWEFCRCGKAGQSLGWDQFQTTDDQFVTHQKSRLKSLRRFPSDLAKRIIPAGRGEQRLDLPPSAIRLFEQVAAGIYRERTA